MRNFLFVALVALCFCIPGNVEANSPITSHIEVLEQSGEMDPALVEQIIRYIQQEYGYDYTCLCDQYATGEMTIEKNAEGYLVTLNDGGVGISIIAEDF